MCAQCFALAADKLARHIPHLSLPFAHRKRTESAEKAQRKHRKRTLFTLVARSLVDCAAQLARTNNQRQL